MLLSMETQCCCCAIDRMAGRVGNALLLYFVVYSFMNKIFVDIAHEGPLPGSLMYAARCGVEVVVDDECD